MRSLLDQKRWTLKAPSGPTGGRPSVLARLLRERFDGQAEGVLRAGGFHPPELLRGMERAVARLARAQRQGEAVFIHGDFDVDGITSTALLYLGLKALGFARLKVEIEDRQRGHGLNEAVVRRLSAEKFSLLITADCGVSDVAPISALNAAGIDTVVTDHHQPPDELPPALALVNPKLPGCAYPNKNLAGVGVAFQLLRALHRHLGGYEGAEEFLDLAMLGTVADLVPLIHDGDSENHRLVGAGLDFLKRGRGNLGLRTLVEQLKLDPTTLTAGRLSFVVAPQINAANRVGDPRVGLLLLTTRRPERARHLAATLIEYNRDRKRAQRQLSQQVDRAIERGQIDLERERLIWLEGDGWNPGILGLVASEVAERYGLPAILISRQGAVSRASARSVDPFNLIGCLQAHARHFLRFGGHRMAAGFLIRTSHLPAARREVLDHARAKLQSSTSPVHEIDLALAPEEVSLELHEELQRLAPFGVGNPRPKFLLSRARLERMQAVGEGRHLKCRARANGHAFEVIGFSLGGYIELLDYFDEVGLVFRLGRNEWLGRTSVQLELADVVEPGEP